MPCCVYWSASGPGRLALCSSMADGVSLFDKLNFDEHVTNVRAGRASSLSFDA
jgi:hypothetical protein